MENKYPPTTVKYYNAILRLYHLISNRNRVKIHKYFNQEKCSTAIGTALIKKGIIESIGDHKYRWVGEKPTLEMTEKIRVEIKSWGRKSKKEIIQANNEKQIIQSLEKENEELRQRLMELKEKHWTKKDPIHTFEVTQDWIEAYYEPKVQKKERYLNGGLVNEKKHTPRMRKPPKQQSGFAPLKPFKLKDWQEFVLVYIISAVISYLILAFTKMDANLIQWNPLERAIVGFLIPTFILTTWIKSKSK